MPEAYLGSQNFACMLAACESHVMLMPVIALQVQLPANPLQKHKNLGTKALLQIQANGLAALQRLDARLTALGDSLAQLERNAGSSMQQGQQEVLDAVSQAQSSLQV